MTRRVMFMMLMMIMAATCAEAANWLNFLENDKGDRFYIDMDTIRHTSESIMKVTRKVEPADGAKITAVVSDIEMDCGGSSIKALNQTTYYIDGSSISTEKNGSFKIVTNSDIDETLLELVCSLRKSKK